MNEELFLFIMGIIKDIAIYFVPIAALGLSIISLHRASRIAKVENKLNVYDLRLKEYDLRLKEYELEKIEYEKQEKQKEIIQKNKANVKARIYKIANSKYKIKIYNCGEGIAYNVDYIIPEEYQIICIKEVVPFEELKSGCNFEEHVIIHNQSSKKYKVTTTWEDSKGNKYNNETLESWQ